LGRSGEFHVEFTPTEVGSHLVEVSIAGQKLPAGPLVAKVYNSSLIQVTDVPSAVIGHACQFRGNQNIHSNQNINEFFIDKTNYSNNGTNRMDKNLRYVN
jgi:hypothetical protein